MTNNIKSFLSSFEKGRDKYYNRKKESERFYQIFTNANFDHLVVHSENLSFIDYLLDKENKKLKFIYLDPPFLSNRDYFNSINIGSQKFKALSYKDFKHKNFDDYIEYITQLLYGCYELLDDNGVIALHLDWHITHYCKLILDEVFGYNHFVNEIIWSYKSGGSSKKSFSKKHDNILIYSKTSQYTFNPILEKSYNRDLKKYSFKGIDEYCDDRGWYTLVNMKDVWSMDMVGRTSKERQGYATQKPLVLLETLIKAFTNPNDYVGDFFLGSGTTLVATNRLKRKFIGCDQSSFSTLTSLNRLDFSNTRFLSSVNYEPNIKYKIEKNELNILGCKLDYNLFSKKDVDILKNIESNNFIRSILILDKNDKLCHTIEDRKGLNNFFRNRKLSDCSILIFDVLGNLTRII